MYKLFIALSILGVAQITQAAKNADPKDLVAEFIGKTGEYSSTENESGPCTLTIESHEGAYAPNYESIAVDAAYAKFSTPSFWLVDYKLKSEKKGVYTFQNQEKNYPGGDSCNQVTYKKQLIIDTNQKSVTFFETYRCLYEGLKKNKRVRVCQF